MEHGERGKGVKGTENGEDAEGRQDMELRGGVISKERGMSRSDDDGGDGDDGSVGETHREDTVADMSMSDGFE